MELGVLIWLALAVIVGIAAARRGRLGFGWFVLAVVLSPLIAGLLLLAVGRGTPDLDPDTHRACPDCAEPILRAARVCKHCGHRLATDAPASADAPAHPAAPARPPNPTLGRIYIALAVLFVAWIFYRLAT